jgi:hypothetical protein
MIAETSAGPAGGGFFLKKMLKVIRLKTMSHCAILRKISMKTGGTA